MAEFVQDRARVRADERRGAGDPGRRFGEPDELTELAYFAEDRVFVLRNEAERDVIGVEQRCFAALGVERDLVRNAGIVERAGPEPRRLRAKARFENRLELPPVFQT